MEMSELPAFNQAEKLQILETIKRAMARVDMTQFKMPIMVYGGKTHKHNTIRMIKCLCMSAIRAWLRRQRAKVLKHRHSQPVNQTA